MEKKIKWTISAIISHFTAVTIIGIVGVRSTKRGLPPCLVFYASDNALDAVTAVIEIRAGRQPFQTVIEGSLKINAKCQSKDQTSINLQCLKKLGATPEPRLKVVVVVVVVVVDIVAVR